MSPTQPAVAERAPAGLRRRAAAEDGITLVELLVATAIALILLGTAVALFTTMWQRSPEISDENAQIQSARSFADTLGRELRQGAAVVGTPTQTSLVLNTWVSSAETCTAPTGLPAGTQTTLANSKLCQVSYSCSGSAGAAICQRRVGTGAWEQVARGLQSRNVFKYLPGGTSKSLTFVNSVATPRFVMLTLSLPTAGDAIVIEDGVALRNRETA